MEFSVWPNLAQPWSDVVEVARHAEATGWNGVWLADHFMGDAGGFGPVETPTLEATAALTGLASLTDRVRLGSLVFGATYRHPAVLANWAATADHISGGRLVLGVGAGWQENEHAQYGIELPPVGARVSRFEEYCRALTGLLPRRAHDHGRHVVHAPRRGVRAQAGPAAAAPAHRGQGRPHAGHRRPLRRRAGTCGACPTPSPSAPAPLDRACAAAGRDPASIRRSTQALVRLTDDEDAARRFVDAVAPRAAVAGTPAQIAEVVAGWRDAGVDEVIVPDFTLGHGSARLDALDQLIEQLAPAFRA